MRRRIGYVGQGNGAGHSQRVRDELVTQGRCYGLAKARPAAAADELLAALELGDLADRTVNTLSGGQRRRLDIALGLVHRPSCCSSTSRRPASTRRTGPTSGSTSCGCARSTARRSCSPPTTSTRPTRIAERVMVIDHGGVIADDTADALKAELAGDRIVLVTDGDESAGRAVAIAGRVGPGPGGRGRGGTVDASGRGGRRHPARAAARPRRRRRRRAAAEVRAATLDDVFLALTGRSLREDAAA